MDKSGYARVFLRQNRVYIGAFTCVREGSREAFARTCSHSVWTKPGTNVDKNRCMVHGGQNRALPKLRRWDRAYTGVLGPKSGIPLIPPLKHSRCPVVHVLKINKYSFVKMAIRTAQSKKQEVFAG